LRLLSHGCGLAKRAQGTHALNDYRDLRVWQVAMDLVVEGYRLAHLLPPHERFGLTPQIRRAAISVPANIAEGYGRLRRGEYLNHLSIARGSLLELQTLLAIAERLGYVAVADLGKSAELCDFVSRMLTRLRRSLEP
jgi:four helix bundle protein